MTTKRAKLHPQIAPGDSVVGSAPIYVFSHGQFIQAVRSLVLDSELSDREKMRKFWGKGSPAIANAGQVEMECREGNWTTEDAGNRLQIAG